MPQAEEERAVPGCGAGLVIAGVGAIVCILFYDDAYHAAKKILQRNDEDSSNGTSGDDIEIDDKIRGQMGPRGWTEDDIRDAVDAGAIGSTTDNTIDRETGERRNDPASVYGSKDEGHVIVNDETGRVVQVTDRNRDDWVPDDRIDWVDEE